MYKSTLPLQHLPWTKCKYLSTLPCWPDSWVWAVLAWLPVPASCWCPVPWQLADSLSASLESLQRARPRLQTRPSPPSVLSCCICLDIFPLFHSQISVFLAFLPTLTWKRLSYNSPHSSHQKGRRPQGLWSRWDIRRRWRDSRWWRWRSTWCCPRTGLADMDLPGWSPCGHTARPTQSWGRSPFDLSREIK